ncbi:hypothetical protein AAHA92_03297 [Salvia divinorum]|uniref:Uncharacterized protein n=1 Tax=Salvia divinorum TaxID=28513 RepID=A0ABD1IGP1_SALDI
MEWDWGKNLIFEGEEVTEEEHETEQAATAPMDATADNELSANGDSSPTAVREEKKKETSLTLEFNRGGEQRGRQKECGGRLKFSNFAITTPLSYRTSV